MTPPTTGETFAHRAEIGPSATQTFVATGEATFFEQLDELTAEHSGEWVAYHGTELLGFGATRVELIREWGHRFAIHKLVFMLIDPAARNLSPN